MSASDAKRLKEFDLESARHKGLLAESMLENEVTKEALRKRWSAHPHGASWCATWSTAD